MEINKELFVLPWEDNFILYLPLYGYTAKVNSGVIDVLKEIQKGQISDINKIPRELIENKVVVEKQEEIKFPTFNEKFEPTSVTIFPTSDCNLRCVYCYGSAGEEHKTIDKEVAFAGIDFVVENALKNKKKEIQVGLHGGGEPLLWKNWDLITSIVYKSKDMAKKYKLKLDMTAGTNGVLNDEQLGFIVKNFARVTLSFDGPKDIQNMQRPPNSYDSVMNTVKFFEKNKFKYFIRSTITELSVNRLEEMVDFFHNITSSKTVHFEPLSECGRCRKTKYKAVNEDEFVENFIKATERANKYGMKINYSGGEVEAIKEKFCGALGSNFFITTEGDISSCLEISKKSDPRSEKFLYGSYNRERGKFDINIEKVKYLSSRTINNISYCSSCFVKYNCASDCPAKIETKTKDMFDPSTNDRCIINQSIIFYKIIQELKKYEKQEGDEK